MKKIVFLTGAGASAESGVKTFRDHDGLWNNHDIMEVASTYGWQKNKELVLEFYNQRRKQLDEVFPNEGHKIIGELEKDFEVVVITQNVDDLHERGGSTKVIHLHGELKKMCSSRNKELTLPYDRDILVGDTHEDGTQLRPFIVWFGESVPLLEDAIHEIRSANIVVILGTSLVVLPAAGLKDYAPGDCDMFYIDPNPSDEKFYREIKVITKVASEGMVELKEILKGHVA